MDKLMVECVNAHDRCEGSGSCPYCEPVQPLRYENGRFAPKHGITIEQAVSKIETLKLALKKPNKTFITLQIVFVMKTMKAHMKNLQLMLFVM